MPKDAKYLDVALRILPDVYNLYGDLGVCLSRVECESRHVAFINGEANGVEIFLYEVKEKKAASRFVRLCAGAAVDFGLPHVGVVMYKGSHADELNSKTRKGHWLRFDVELSK